VLKIAETRARKGKMQAMTRNFLHTTDLLSEFEGKIIIRKIQAEMSASAT
jgi:hypothetical protein